LLRKGNNLTVVATSWMNVEAMRAAEVLKKYHGTNLEIIDPRTVAPLDYEMIYDSVNKTKHCIVADYDWLYCGFSAEVAARISEHCFNKLQAPVARVGFSPTPCPTTRPLENKFYSNAVDIIRLAEKILNLKPADLAKEEFYSYENKFKGPF